MQTNGVSVNQLVETIDSRIMNGISGFVFQFLDQKTKELTIIEFDVDLAP